MDINDRSWTTEELRRVAEDDRLATLLLNKTTFSKEEIQAFYTLKARKFHVWLGNQKRAIVVKAVNEESLGWFLEQEYECLDIAEVSEVINNKIRFSDYVEIPLEKLKLGGQIDGLI